MRLLLITLLSSFLISNITWETDFQRAKQSARAEHKCILLNFAGSDWCGPCIRLHNQIFESNVFTKYAGDQLILVKADFPRLKKNQLSKEQQMQNDKLADEYNKKGVFPLTLLLNPEGKILKSWDGFPNESADEFTNEVKAAVNADK